MRNDGNNVHLLRDGTLVQTRPLRASDRSKLLTAFEHLSAESRYRRFFSPTPRLSPRMLDRLLDVDGRDRLAIGAEQLRLGWLPGRGLGVARYSRLPEARNVAELALAIIDDLQGKGLGTLLLLELSRAARAHGITRFVAWVQPDNEPMKAVVLKLDPLARSRVEDGLLVFDLAVPGSIAVPVGQRGRGMPGALGALADWCEDGLRQLIPGRLPDPPAHPA